MSITQLYIPIIDANGNDLKFGDLTDTIPEDNAKYITLNIKSNELISAIYNQDPINNNNIIANNNFLNTIMNFDINKNRNTAIKMPINTAPNTNKYTFSDVNIIQNFYPLISVSQHDSNNVKKIEQTREFLNNIQTELSYLNTVEHYNIFKEKITNFSYFVAINQNDDNTKTSNTKTSNNTITLNVRTENNPNRITELKYYYKQNENNTDGDTDEEDEEEEEENEENVSKELYIGEHFDTIIALQIFQNMMIHIDTQLLEHKKKDDAKDKKESESSLVKRIELKYNYCENLHKIGLSDNNGEKLNEVLKELNNLQNSIRDVILTDENKATVDRISKNVTKLIENITNHLKKQAIIIIEEHNKAQVQGLATKITLQKNGVLTSTEYESVNASIDYIYRFLFEIKDFHTFSKGDDNFKYKYKTYLSHLPFFFMNVFSKIGKENIDNFKPIFTTMLKKNNTDGYFSMHDFTYISHTTAREKGEEENEENAEDTPIQEILKESKIHRIQDVSIRLNKNITPSEEKCTKENYIKQLEDMMNLVRKIRYNEVVMSISMLGSKDIGNYIHNFKDWKIHIGDNEISMLETNIFTKYKNFLRFIFYELKQYDSDSNNLTSNEKSTIDNITIENAISNNFNAANNSGGLKETGRYVNIFRYLEILYDIASKQIIDSYQDSYIYIRMLNHALYNHFFIYINYLLEFIGMIYAHQHNDSSKDALKVLKELVRKKNSDNILTYIKFRNDNDDYYNPRYNFLLDQHKNGEDNESRSMVVQYANNDIPYYNSRNEKINDVSYNEQYTFGNFTKIFEPKLTNEEVAESMSEIIYKLNKNKTVFIMGYGASGAGKTSTLIQLNITKSGGPIKQPGILIELCKAFIKNKKGKQVTGIELRIQELYNDFFKQAPNNDKGSKPQIHDYPKDSPQDPQQDPQQEWLQFKYDDNSIKLQQEYTHTMSHSYAAMELDESTKTKLGIKEEENNNKIIYKRNFEKNSEMADVIDFLVNYDRLIKATTNNDESSRSHVIVYVRFKIDKKKETPCLIVGDFAGVENEFKCDQEMVKNQFLNIKMPKKKIESEPFFYGSLANKDLPSFDGNEEIHDFGRNSTTFAYDNDLINKLQTLSQSVIDKSAGEQMSSIENVMYMDKIDTVLIPFIRKRMEKYSNPFTSITNVDFNDFINYSGLEVTKNSNIHTISDLEQYFDQNYKFKNIEYIIKGERTFLSSTADTKITLIDLLQEYNTTIDIKDDSIHIIIGDLSFIVSLKNIIPNTIMSNRTQSLSDQVKNSTNIQTNRSIGIESSSYNKDLIGMQRNQNTPQYTESYHNEEKIPLSAAAAADNNKNLDGMQSYHIKSQAALSNQDEKIVDIKVDKSDIDSASSNEDDKKKPEYNTSTQQISKEKLQKNEGKLNYAIAVMIQDNPIVIMKKELKKKENKKGEGKYQIKNINFMEYKSIPNFEEKILQKILDKKDKLDEEINTERLRINNIQKSKTEGLKKIVMETEQLKENQKSLYNNTINEIIKTYEPFSKDLNSDNSKAEHNYYLALSRRNKIIEANNSIAQYNDNLLNYKKVKNIEPKHADKLVSKDIQYFIHYSDDSCDLTLNDYGSTALKEIFNGVKLTNKIKIHLDDLSKSIHREIKMFKIKYNYDMKNDEKIMAAIDSRLHTFNPTGNGSGLAQFISQASRHFSRESEISQTNMMNKLKNLLPTQENHMNKYNWDDLRKILEDKVPSQYALQLEEYLSKIDYTKLINNKLSDTKINIIDYRFNERFNVNDITVNNDVSICYNGSVDGTIKITANYNDLITIEIKKAKYKSKDKIEHIQKRISESNKQIFNDLKIEYVNDNLQNNFSAVIIEESKPIYSKFKYIKVGDEYLYRCENTEDIERYTTIDNYIITERTNPISVESDDKTRLSNLLESESVLHVENLKKKWLNQKSENDTIAELTKHINIIKPEIENLKELNNTDSSFKDLFNGVVIDYKESHTPATVKYEKSFKKITAIESKLLNEYNTIRKMFTDGNIYVRNKYKNMPEEKKIFLDKMYFAKYVENMFNLNEQQNEIENTKHDSTNDNIISSNFNGKPTEWESNKELFQKVRMRNILDKCIDKDYDAFLNKLNQETDKLISDTLDDVNKENIYICINDSDSNPNKENYIENLEFDVTIIDKICENSITEIELKNKYGNETVLDYTNQIYEDINSEQSGGTTYDNPPNGNVLQNIIIMKVILEFLQKEAAYRKTYIQQICNNRKYEGQFINASLQDMRENIRTMMKIKNENTIDIVPDLIQSCIDYYCPTKTACFDFKEETNIKSDFQSILMKTMYDTLKNDTSVKHSSSSNTIDQINQGIKEVKNFYKNFQLCVFCVFNMTGNYKTNNPPPIPYVNINDLKHYWYSYKNNILSSGDKKTPDTLYIEPTMDINEQLRRFVSLVFSGDYKSQFEKLYQKAIKTIDIHNDEKTSTKLSVLNHDISLYKNNYVNGRKHNIKITAMENIIKCIDNSNALSAIGTLEFMDQIAKFNTTNVVYNISYVESEGSKITDKTEFHNIKYDVIDNDN